MSEGFKGVPGVPDGWELVAIRKALNSEFIVNAIGNAEMWNHTLPSEYLYPIIRKIEQPAKYRAFANAEEFKPHRDRWIKLTIAESDGVYLTYQVASYDDWGVIFGGSKETYQAVFNRYVFDGLDGTTEPFGVKIDE
jgi:hypothetical protein